MGWDSRTLGMGLEARAFLDDTLNENDGMIFHGLLLF